MRQSLVQLPSEIGALPLGSESFLVLQQYAVQVREVGAEGRLPVLNDPVGVAIDRAGVV